MQADNHRSGEGGHVPERNSRFLQKSGYWYFLTREGLEIGPFDTLSDAQEGVANFIDFICGAEPQVKALLERYRAA